MYLDNKKVNEEKKLNYKILFLLKYIFGVIKIKNKNLIKIFVF
jgi:hypothetical protein